MLSERTQTSSPTYPSTSGPESHAVARIRKSSRRSAVPFGADGSRTISLALGEPDTDTPDAVVLAAIGSLTKGRTRYAPMSGTPKLLDALAGTATAVSGRAIGTDQIALTHGGSAGLAAVMMAMLNPGDKVLIPEPTYSLYGDQAAMIGADVSWIPHRKDGSLDLETLEMHAGSARLLVLCNPGNPTGHVYSDEDLRRVEELLVKHPGLYLLSDEAYGAITYNGELRSALTLHRAAEQVVVCSTFSKSYAMTGWRLGHIVAHPELTERIRLIHCTINGPLNTFVQDAALQALQTPETELRAAALSYQERRDLVHDRLSGHPRIHLPLPRGAFYAFPRIDSTLTSDEMTARFTAAGVLVRSGTEFGPSGEGHVRISFATDSSSLTEGLARFLEVVKDLP